MADEYLAEGKRLFEFRLLRLEKDTEDRERRLGMVERQCAEMSTRLRTLDSIEKMVEDMRAAQSRMMFGVILSVISVIGTFILGHFGPVPK